MPQIIPIKELKNTSNLSQMVRETYEPIFITKNGYGDMVLMSMEYYENEIKKEKIYRELAASENNISDGKVANAREGIESLKVKYDL